MSSGIDSGEYHKDLSEQILKKLILGKCYITKQGAKNSDIDKSTGKPKVYKFSEIEFPAFYRSYCNKYVQECKKLELDLTEYQESIDKRISNTLYSTLETLIKGKYDHFKPKRSNSIFSERLDLAEPTKEEILEPQLAKPSSTIKAELTKEGTLLFISNSNNNRQEEKEEMPKGKKYEVSETSSSSDEMITRLFVDSSEEKSGKKK